MSLRDNRFLQPEKSGQLVGWAARQLMLWGAIALVICIVIGHGISLPGRQPAPASPAAVETVAPGKPAETVSNSLILRAGQDGHVFVDASVNGTPLHMAFDTGASLVSLTQADAARAGIGGGLNYTMEFATANGRTYGAPVTLREIRIGQLTVEDVEAVVMQNLGVSLLGQSLLNRLESYRMRDGVMTLTW